MTTEKLITACLLHGRCVRVYGTQRQDADVIRVKGDDGRTDIYHAPSGTIAAGEASVFRVLVSRNKVAKGRVEAIEELPETLNDISFEF